LLLYSLCGAMLCLGAHVDNEIRELAATPRGSNYNIVAGTQEAKVSYRFFALLLRVCKLSRAHTPSTSVHMCTMGKPGRRRAGEPAQGYPRALQRKILYNRACSELSAFDQRRTWPSSWPCGTRCKVCVLSGTELLRLRRTKTQYESDVEGFGRAFEQAADA
jgi:hypothetical protein